MAKSKETRAEKHEYCPGYVDEYGIWNNGFLCPRWGGPEERYCCGTTSKPFCCPPPAVLAPTGSGSPTSTTPARGDKEPDAGGDADLDIAQYIPIIIGVSVALFVLIAVILIGCFLCRCCPGYKRRKPRSPVSQAQSSESCSTCQNHTASTSACASGCTSSTTDSSNLHCGCRWSPSNSRNTVVDIDQMLLTLYENPTAAWQQELESHLQHFPIDEPPPYTENHQVKDVDLLKNLDSKSESSDTYLEGAERDTALLSLLSQTQIQPASDINVSLSKDKPERQTSNDPSVLCMTTFRPLNSPRSLEIEVQKRDSGVLVEDSITDIGLYDRPYTVNTSPEQTIVVKPGRSRRTSRSSLDILHSPIDIESRTITS